MADYYDWILFAIAASLTLGAILGAATGIPVRVALAASVLVATPFVYDALFRNPPLPPEPTTRAAAAVVWHVLVVWALLSLLT